MPQLLLAFILIGATSLLGAADLQVPQDYVTIQSAMVASASGDTIYVAPGTYSEEINFLGKEIRLVSTDGPETTILDGLETLQLVKFHNSENSLAILEGFTLTRGYAFDICGFAGCDYIGPAVDIYESSPTLKNNVFINNSTQGVGTAQNLGQGGAIVVNQGSPTIERCLFTHNQSEYAGGAIALLNSNAIIDRCTFYGNSAIHGSAVFTSGAQPTIINTIIWGNTGMSQLETQSLVISVSFSDVQFYGNNGSIIDTDPFFVDPDNGDFNLQANSPCIDTGDMSTPLDPDGSRADMGAFPFSSDTQFNRGNCNDDASFNLADIVLLLSKLFPNGTPPTLACEDACDMNDDGSLNIADAIAGLGALFSNPAPQLPLPYGACGQDPSTDTLDCAMANPGAC